MCAMVYSNNRTMRESMPQTVPSVGASPPPCDYSHFAADSFDLSLLPSTDCEVPYSPTNIHQLMALFYDPTNSPPPMFHNSLQDEAFFQDFETTNPFKVYVTMDKSDDRPGTSSPPAYPYPPNATPVKEEPYSAYMLGSSDPNTPSCYAPLSPAGSTSSSSCTYSTQASPHHHRSSPSPMQSNIMIKQEQTIDLQEILKESKFLQESLDSFDSNVQTPPQGACADQASSSITIKTEVNPLTSSCIKEEPIRFDEECSGNTIGGEKTRDHQLLREVLRDTSFQRKYNLKSFDFAGALGTGFIGSEGASTSTAQDIKMEETETPRAGDVLMSDVALSREKIEPVLSLAIEQLRKDVNNTCSVLGITSDPALWSVDDVKAWLLWTLRQYSLPLIQIEYFNMDGVALSNLSEEEFQRRAPQCGSTLHAQLEIWKAACAELETHLDMGDAMQWDKSTKSTSSSGEPSEDEEEEVEPVVPVGGGKTTGSTRGGSHIHLWQFLKELLASPQLHGSCIRWLERSKGVFKIEDSVRVARLWGKRKNRPAMNYDKLSRSIRQYYKKGIMKKTERSQRLVYQFCHPYCL